MRQAAYCERHVKRLRRAVGLLVAGLWLSAMQASVAQNQTASASRFESAMMLPYGGATLERYFERLRQDFLQLDADSDGKISRDDVDLHTVMEEAMLRAFAAMSVMQFDVNGDGAVTEDEIRQGSRYWFRSALKSRQQDLENEVRSIMLLDTDKDGKVSFVEAGQYRSTETRRNLGLPETSSRARQALTLASGPGVGISLQDFMAAGEALFRKIDSDHDGKASLEELAAYGQAR